MATELRLNILMKPSKWFSNKNLRRKSSSRSSNSSSTLTSPRSPTSPPPQPKKKSIIMTTRDQEDDLVNVFRHFDGDGDGKISALELRSYFGSVGDYLSHEEAQSLIRDLDSDGDDMLDYQDFTKLMNKSGGDDVDDDDMMKAFEMFVWEEGSGCITPKGLQRMLHRLGDDKSYEDCVVMIDAFDVDHNGVLDFHEFQQMMLMP